MNLDERFADLRCAVDAEIARARSEAIADLLRTATRVRAASHETEWTAAIEDAERTFEGDAAAVEFLKTLAPPPVSRAQQFARVRVAEIQLYHSAAMKAGRASGDVYSALKTQMDAGRDAYREKFLTPVNGTADYLHAEFVRTLANDDAALLGPEYPGPLV
jgi:transposase